MTGLVAGKVAVVTGGASGVGRATAAALAREGAAGVVIADLRDSPREGGRPSHEEIGCPASFVECDVSRPVDVERAVAAADEFGGIDIMVNNAGIVIPGDFLEVTEEHYDRQMSVNAKGTFFGTQIAARRMVERGGGVIVNISSIGGIVGTATTAVYCAAKAASRLIAYSAAHAVGNRNVRVNAIHPGIVATEMLSADLGVTSDQIEQVAPMALGRPAEPADIADAVVMVCSDQARYVTGTSLVVDGGLISNFG